jgi:uncharacterized membrane protein YfcA
MSVYLPIAEMPVNALLVILVSGAIGFLSGMVGVGGGFVLTPALIFMGVPPAVAVATQGSQITASSVSGVIAHSRRRGLDLRIALLLTIGGIAGTTTGVTIFALLKRQGQVDLLITFLYVVLLSVVGSLMLWESVRAMRRRAMGITPPRRQRKRGLAHRLPLRMRFPRSGLYISVIPILVIGAFTGLLAAMMGVGGGFVMVPAMIYMLRMPGNLVVGTSLFAITLMTAQATIQHALQTKTVDAILAVLLMVGGVVGAQWGARVGSRLKADELRVILALVVVGTALRLVWDLVSRPAELFSLAT